MTNLYLCITAMLGLLGVVFGLAALIPQGMWLYLGAVIWGTATVALSLAAIIKEEA
jgi:hypothetical protein